ncbi:MAG: glycerophosphodiester phosphodiesterase family protein [Clostridia bacterium]|nr:glycerophosphodiester phosphodiesterase family protein [Clostridia bacterium]
MKDLRELIKERKVLLASHRGVNGGNIPCNSLQSYLIAVNQDADIIELDISVTADKQLFLLHPGMEWVHLGKSIDVSKMQSKDVKELFLHNQDVVETQYPIITFDEVLDALKDKCFINVDKFWGDPETIAKTIRKHGMANQCIVKSYADKNTPAMLKQYAYDMQYMAMIRDKDAVLPEFFADDINFVGFEVLFDNDNNPIVSDEFIEKMHEKGKILWGNSICYNYRDVIASDHVDDVALLGNPDHGWGYFAKKGFDIIQTDWLTQCDQYLKSKGYRK